MSNMLKNETSPYLLQHTENPVNWYPWRQEAFEKARAEDKPIFLSIGYSSCHWCHVMAHESFESLKTAEILNEKFISIKVDREERPDIDSVYMSVCQAFTGSGGWPMSIFMTWDKKPFFAGTYFPPYSRHGMPGFFELLNAISSQWQNNRYKLINSADMIIKQLKMQDIHNKPVNGNPIEEAMQIFSESFDSVNGGFGSAPKFPSPHNLMFLTMYAYLTNNDEALHMVEKTLIQMRKGGIFDQIGCGFSRYSTDNLYLTPHFEKMLYDNALMIISYSAVYSITKNNIYLNTAEKTANYVLREMTSTEGGFYSAQDADSEGVEGKYYTFSLKEILSVLGEEGGRKFAGLFDITEAGNFESGNIPNLLKSNDLTSDLSEEIKKQLQEKEGRDYPDYLIACVGGGSNAAGTIYHYINDERVGIILAEAGGKGIETGMTAATIQLGKMGIIHGARTYVIQNEDGQIEEPYSISAGLDYPGIGPIHANLAAQSRANVLAINDDEAIEAAYELTKLEGIIPALESAHALGALNIEVQAGRYRCIDCFGTRRQRY